MNELHHANIVISKGDCRDFVFELLENRLDFKVRANPDFLLIENTFFGIDDARDLERWAMGKPLLGEVKASIIIVKSITLEAQNALLKVLEEPPLGTYFFICTESLGGILPTFMSRVRILDAAENQTIDEGPKDAASKFLKSDIKSRFALIKSLSKKEDKSQMLELLRGLEVAVYENYKDASDKEDRKSEVLKNILIAKVFVSSRGSSPKMLMEWLACVV